jgi:hypothetical protein
MPRVLRTIATVAMVATSLAAAGTARATNTAVVTPSPAVAVRSTSLRFAVNATTTLQCADMAGSGTVNATSSGSLPLAFGTVTPVMPTAGPGWCSTGAASFTVTCQPMTLSAVGTTTGTGTTSVIISRFSCHVASVSAPSTCHNDIVGSIAATFANATNTLTLSPPLGQALQAIGSTCALLPNSTVVSLTTPSGGQLVLQVSGSGGTGTRVTVT